jgi:hypothetical protein
VNVVRRVDDGDGAEFNKSTHRGRNLVAWGLVRRRQDVDRLGDGQIGKERLVFGRQALRRGGARDDLCSTSTIPRSKGVYGVSPWDRVDVAGLSRTPGRG